MDDRSNVVLVVEDTELCRLAMKWFLNAAGHVVDVAENAEVALRLFNPMVHSVVVTDNIMPGMSGADMAALIKQRSPLTPIVMYSGNPPNYSPWINAIIQKPASFALVKEAIDVVLVSALRPDNVLNQQCSKPFSGVQV